MSMARPAAEIEPHSRMFSNSWILPGPIRPSVSRSMRTLSDGSGLAGDFCIEDLPLATPGATLPSKPFPNKMKASPNPSAKYRGRNEVSAFAFAVEGWTLPAQAPRGAGALDADARGEAVPRAATPERRILR